MTHHSVIRFVFGLLACIVILTGAALSQTPKEQAWQILQQAASDSGAMVRADHARALGFISNNPKVITLLEQTLRDNDPGVRSAAARATSVSSGRHG